MKDVEFSFKNFKFKKLAALAACAALALGVMVMPVDAAAGKQTGDAGYTGDVSKPLVTADASDPKGVIDAIEQAGESGKVLITVPEGTKELSASVFEAAIKNKTVISLQVKTADGKNVSFTFSKGITKAVDLNLGLSVSTSANILKNLNEENAIAFDFAHSGELPGEMTVALYDEAYAGVESESLPFYYFNEVTGKLELQENTASSYKGTIVFSITHCSTYVVAEKEVAATKLQVAEPNANAKVEEPAKKSPLVAAGMNSGTKTVALLAICGAAVFFATRKEEKA